LYLTLATYDKAYEEYIRYSGEGSNVDFTSTKDGPFLRMNIFGPYYIGEADHKKSFGRFVLAFVLQMKHGSA